MPFLADNLDPIEIPLAAPLLAIEVGLGLCGLVVISGLLRRLFDAQRRAALRDWPSRPNGLFPEFAVAPILAYVGSGLILHLVLDLPAEDSGRIAPRALLAGSLAQLIGGVACLVVAALTFEGGLGPYWRGSASIGRQVHVGVLGLLAAYPLCWVFAKLTELVLSRFAPGFTPPQHEVLKLLGQPELPGWVVPMLWVSAVLVAPFAEEAFFRSVCQTALNHVFKGRWPAIVIVSFLFGLSHYPQPHFVPPLIVLGAVLGYVYERTGSMIAPFTLHLLFNLKTMVFFAVGGGQE